MPWRCRLVDKDTFWRDDYVPQPGDLVFRCPPDVWPSVVANWRASGSRRDDPRMAKLSDEYFAGRIDQRPPLWLVLPSPHLGYVLFGVDGPAKGTTRGWNVSGEPPNLTLTPSIDCSPDYHGWLTNGVLSDG